MEIVWNGIHAVRIKDKTLTCKTSIWMFPIYGLIIIMEPIYLYLSNVPVILRGGVYSIIILSAEYLTGILLKKIGVCPWDYSESKYNIKGVIRIDYIPVWFAAGLIYERIYTYISTYAFHG